MEERAQEEAQAKMGDELRETRRKLQRQVNATTIIEQKKKQMEKEGEDRLKHQEKQARYLAKDLIIGHKRELAEILYPYPYPLSISISFSFVRIQTVRLRLVRGLHKKHNPKIYPTSYPCPFTGTSEHKEERWRYKEKQE
jgi:hypothetical protein